LSSFEGFPVLRRQRAGLHGALLEDAGSLLLRLGKGCIMKWQLLALAGYREV
jgi:hypothetical protein